MNILFLVITFFNVIPSTPLEKKGEIYPIAFYNVENLFDTQRNNLINDEDFTPNGKYNWTEERYVKKLNNLAYVMSKLGKEHSKVGFTILGLAEVENKKVLQDLIRKINSNKTIYKIVHQDSPDARGIDVALIYNPNLYTVKSFKIYPFRIPGKNTIKTRDILVVDGTLNKEPLCIVVNHWPSRRGNNTEYLRERSADICKHIADSISTINPKAGIIIMGDLNDNPNSTSTSKILQAKRKPEYVKQGELYNTMWQLFEKGVGSFRYNNEWHLFDQIIISENLLKGGKSNLNYVGSEVFNKKFLIQQSGKFKGYPLRTYSGTKYQNGYSDHLPTLIYLHKNK